MRATKKCGMGNLGFRFVQDKIGVGQRVIEMKLELSTKLNASTIGMTDTQALA